jgi:hypothetical protein
LELNDAVQSIDAGDWLGLAGYYWDALDTLPYGHLAVAGAGAFVVLILVLVAALPAGNATATAADKPLPRVGGQGFIERRRSPARFERPLVLYGRTYETYERLIGIASIPGTGKSSLLAEMMWQSGGRCIVVSGGKSPPLIDTVYAMGGRHWETTGVLGIDLLSGDYRRVPQVLEEMFDKGAGDGGLFRSLFRQITRDYLKEVDATGDPRSFEGIVQALRNAKAADYPGVNPTMIGNWSARMNEVLDSLGPALGTDLNVLDACTVGVPVLFTLDKRRDPSGSLRRMFAKAAISAGTQAVAAGHAPMFLIDELGLLDADAIAEDARTFREAGVLFAAAAHGKQDFGQDLRSLIDFWIFGTLAADEPESRRWASETTFGTRSSESFGGHALPKGHFVVWDGSRVHDDLIVPRYSRREWIWSTPELPERTVPPVAGTVEERSGTVESGTADDGELLPAWVTDDADRQRFWKRMRRESCGCLRWLGGDNGQGRPKGHLTVVGADGKKKKISPTVYVLTYEWVNGEDSAEPTLDHVCHTDDETCPGNDACEWRDCENPMHPVGEPCQHGLCCENTHLEPVSIQVNQERNAAQKKRHALWWSKVSVRGVGAAAAD